MMMKFSILTVMVFLFLSCSDDSSQEASNEATSVNVVPTKQQEMETDARGITTQYYPNSKIIKAQGRLDEEGKRHGIWYGYDKNGFKASQSDYNHGLKNGVHIVYRPNGQIFYTGEYRNDKEIGIWNYYNEDGTLNQSKDFSAK